MADELLELGDPGNSRKTVKSLRRPFLSGGPRLGQAVSEVSDYMAGIFQDTLRILTDLAGTSIEDLVRGLSFSFDGIRNLVREVPATGGLLAEVLVSAGSVIRFGVSLPGMTTPELGNVFGKLRGIFNEEFTESERTGMVRNAKVHIAEIAPDNLRGSVQQVLQSPGEAPIKEDGTEILSVLLPVGVVGMALALLI